MATIIRGQHDAIVTSIKAALDAYEREFPGAKADIYRQNSASVRVRVIDERFAGMSRWERHKLVWDFLNQRVDSDSMEELAVLLPFPPGELKDSLANMDFDNPLPSEL